jgi:hypothetical protein
MEIFLEKFNKELKGSLGELNGDEFVGCLEFRGEEVLVFKVLRKGQVVVLVHFEDLKKEHIVLDDYVELFDRLKEFVEGVEIDGFYHVFESDRGDLRLFYFQEETEISNL